MFDFYPKFSVKYTQNVNKIWYHVFHRHGCIFLAIHGCFTPLHGIMIYTDVLF